MVTEPLVTVLMPAFNAASFLLEAVTSILEQTFTNFELLVIDDGSTDGSFELLENIKDSRLRVVRNHQNLKLIKTLNIGLDLARGKYIARLDADDISLPQRIEKQVEFLEQHPEVGIIGTAIQLINDQGKFIRNYVPPTDDLSIRWNSLFYNPILHPTVMMRRSIIKQNNLKYDPTWLHCEDYDFWIRFMQYTQSYNLNEALVKHRIHSQSVSKKNQEVQKQNADKIAFNAIRDEFPGFTITAQELSQLRYWLADGLNFYPIPKNCYKKILELYLKIFYGFSEKNKTNLNGVNLKRQVAFRLVRAAILRTPLSLEQVYILAKAFSLDPSWIVIFMELFPEAIYHNWYKNMYVRE